MRIQRHQENINFNLQAGAGIGQGRRWVQARHNNGINF